MGTTTEKIVYEADTSGVQRGAKEAGNALQGLQSKVAGLTGAIGTVGTIARGFGLLELVNVAVQGINFVKSIAKAAVQEILDEQLRLAGVGQRFGGGTAPGSEELAKRIADAPGEGILGFISNRIAAGIGALAIGAAGLAATATNALGFEDATDALRGAMENTTDAIHDLTRVEEEAAADRQRALDRAVGQESRITQRNIPALLGQIRDITVDTEQEGSYREIVDALNGIRNVVKRQRFLLSALQKLRDEIQPEFVLPDD